MALAQGWVFVEVVLIAAAILSRQVRCIPYNGLIRHFVYNVQRHTSAP